MDLQALIGQNTRACNEMAEHLQNSKKEKEKERKVGCSCSFGLQAAYVLPSGSSVNHRVRVEQL